MSAVPAPRILTPADGDGVAAALRTCAREGAAVVAFGGSTLQSIGNAPHRCDVELHLSALSGVREYDPRDMTIGLDAGTTLAQAERVLAAAGQWLPFDAPQPERATVGGTLAAGWAGPRRARYGGSRDLLIGSTVALTDGTLAHAGGMVVKNVTGYDMSKIYIGSLGTLGIVVRANFKTLPRPATVRLAVAPVPEDVPERAVAAAGSLEIEPAAALLVDGFRVAGRPRGAGLRLLALFEGSEAVVERGVRSLRSALGKGGVSETAILEGDDAARAFAALVDAYVEVLAGRSLTYRSTGLPSTVWARTRSALRLAREFGLLAEHITDVRTGDAILRFSTRGAAAIAAALPAFDAALRAGVERATVLAGAPLLRAAVDAWGTEPSTIATMRALKTRFDPDGILAPGRYVGAI